MKAIAWITTCTALISVAAAARADIYQWEYINPADPSQGKQQSTTLAPDGAGIDAVPGANLSSRVFPELIFDLTMAYLNGVDLSHATLRGTSLQNASLVGANLSAADFSSICACPFFGGASPISADLTAADLSQANLTNANFAAAILTDTDFTDAEVRGANFVAVSYHCGVLGCAAAYYGTGITLDQLYSTASYQAHDLTGVGLFFNSLSGANFAGQNLTHAEFVHATLIDADFRQANLTNSDFINANVGGADLTAADARGAYLFGFYGSAITTNLIGPDGHISGLDLDAGGLLVVRDYDGNPVAFPEPTGPIPITVDQHLAMGPGGTLRMVFEADAWDSTISFAPGIPVTLGGTLELTFADDVNPATQLGRTFDLFDWTGVTPAGTFAISSPYKWDTANLYTTGRVTLTAIPEPATAFLALAGLACFLATSRKRPSG